jgi:hypothetical protein
MSAAESLLPCPFCEGPPVVIVQDSEKGGAAPVQNDYGEGLWVKAFVFCHECGAEGPSLEELIFFGDEYDVAERGAVERWQQRDARHRDCYDAGEADGLNLYPRPDLEATDERR